MTEPTVNEDARFALLKKIDGKLAWICFFLILITLNTCSLEDRVGDAIRDMREGETSAPDNATPPAVAPETAPAPTTPAS